MGCVQVLLQQSLLQHPPAAIVDGNAPLSLLDVNDAQCGEEESRGVDGNVAGVRLCVLRKQCPNTGGQAGGNVGKDKHTGAVAQLQLTDGVCGGGKGAGNEARSRRELEGGV